MSEELLHDHSEFGELLQNLARNLKIPSELIEKDYWLMHCLWALGNQGLKFELKGGTSLSKGWGIIRRFSEDVDIKIFPPEGMVVRGGKNDTKPKHRENREAYFAWLKAELKIPGASYIRRDTEFDDRDLRNAGLRIGYPTAYAAFAGLKDGILLEVGFDVTTPNEKKDISSWAYDFALQSGLNVRDNRAIEIPCYLPEYTFVEKLSAISKKYRQEVAGKNVQNFTRHYYDIFQLLAEPRVQTFIGSSEYRGHKEARFGKDDDRDLSTNPAFTMPDSTIRSRFAERFAAASALYFTGQPSFDEIIDRIQSFASRL